MDARYPIGKFEKPAVCGPAERAEWIAAIAALPAQVKAALAALPEGGLDRPYREGGWTARQVVHHLADSHMNAFIRVKLALTEESPTICAYDENAWAHLADGCARPVEESLAILEGLHARLAALLASLDEPQWARTYVHPAYGPRDIAATAGLYAWHGRHHVGLIR
jgi:hypothetical protein